MSVRIEKDSMGEVRVPAHAYYGAQTQRAVDNFQISGLRMPREFIRALGIVKWAAARSNESLGLLDPKLSAAIQQAADEVIEGQTITFRLTSSNRLRHVDEYEHQRGHCQPGH